jgi:hypothetical protein
MMDNDHCQKHKLYTEHIKHEDWNTLYCLMYFIKMPYAGHRTLSEELVNQFAGHLDVMLIFVEHTELGTILVAEKSYYIMVCAFQLI